MNQRHSDPRGDTRPRARGTPTAKTGERIMFLRFPQISIVIPRPHDVFPVARHDRVLGFHRAGGYFRVPCPALRQASPVIQLTASAAAHKGARFDPWSRRRVGAAARSVDAGSSFARGTSRYSNQSSRSSLFDGPSAKVAAIAMTLEHLSIGARLTSNRPPSYWRQDRRLRHQ
jgi:hypothetical protein